MAQDDLAAGAVFAAIGILLFFVGAVVVTTIWWVGVCFIMAGMALMGFGVFVLFNSNAQMPTMRGF